MCGSLVRWRKLLSARAASGIARSCCSSARSAATRAGAKPRMPGLSWVPREIAAGNTTMLARMIAARIRWIATAIHTSLKNCKFYTTWVRAYSIACEIIHARSERYAGRGGIYAGAGVRLTGLAARRRLVARAAGRVWFTGTFDESFDFGRLRAGGCGAHERAAGRWP